MCGQQNSTHKLRDKPALYLSLSLCKQNVRVRGQKRIESAQIFILSSSCCSKCAKYTEICMAFLCDRLEETT